jgi:hypothetical protein
VLSVRAHRHRGGRIERPAVAALAACAGLADAACGAKGLGERAGGGVAPEDGHGVAHLRGHVRHSRPQCRVAWKGTAAVTCSWLPTFRSGPSARYPSRRYIVFATMVDSSVLVVQPRRRASRKAWRISSLAVRLV